MNPRHRRRLLLLLASAAAVPLAAAQNVTLAGNLGATKALLMIDGQPQTLAVGASARGVTLRRVGDGEAEVEVGGQRLLLRLGAAPARVGGGGNVPGAGREIVLTAGPGGHFSTEGLVNGKPVPFLVDTGATTIALSQSMATRIGLDWRQGRRGWSSTAGGTVPVYGVNLTSVRIGDVEVYNVDAVVLPNELPAALLGNSFLSRFSMHREADVMRLERK